MSCLRRKTNMKKKRTKERKNEKTEKSSSEK